MSWVKLDDGFSEHPKIADLSAEAFRAHVTALCYACRNLTDGLVPTLIAKQITTPRLLKELTKELWTADPAGFRIHDFLEYNPNRESILAKRAADSARNRGGIAAEYLGPVPDPLPIPDPAPDPGPATPIPVPSRVAAVAFEKSFGRLLSPTELELVKALEEEQPPERIEFALREAAALNKRSVRYVQRTCERIERDGGAEREPVAARKSLRYDD